MENYLKIGKIAKNSDTTIKASEIASLFNTSGRGIFNMIKAAYYFYYRQGNPETAEKIAKTFTRDDGSYAY